MDVIVVLVFSAATLIVIACLMARRLQLGEMATLRRDGNPVLRRELRRRVEMRTHADGLGGVSFPEPAETRVLCWQVCALPVWSRTESIGLPVTCEGCIEAVRPEDYDQHFTPAFKLIGEPKRAGRRASRTAAA